MEDVLAVAVGHCRYDIGSLADVRVQDDALCAGEERADGV